MYFRKTDWNEVYPDWPLSVELCRWKYLRDKVCSIALPMLLVSLALWENAAVHSMILKDILLFVRHGGEQHLTSVNFHSVGVSWRMSTRRRTTPFLVIGGMLEVCNVNLADSKQHSPALLVSASSCMSDWNVHMPVLENLDICSYWTLYVCCWVLAGIETRPYYEYIYIFFPSPLWC